MAASATLTIGSPTLSDSPTSLQQSKGASETTTCALPKATITASVREVVSFILCAGDLGGSGGFSGRHRALEGLRGHQRLQKNRPSGYEAEVPVRWQAEQAQFVFELKGRIDGVLVQGGSLLVEEIKTIRVARGGLADPLHWGQAKIYAYLYGREHGFKQATVRISYLELQTEETVTFEESFSLDALQEFFDSVLGEYLEWVTQQQEWCKVRNQSIQQLAFPFKSFRPGQRSLAVAVYRTVKSGGKLFAEAPTGIGKTASVLFPTIKAMGEGRPEKIFYLTAKTIGRSVAQETLSALRSAGLRLRAVTLTARDKICFNEGLPCDLKTCPYAVGYYDRIKVALRDALKSENGEVFSRGQIEAIAKKHRVCPFELSLDLSVWADAVICDYNYVFDPSVSLKRYFDDEKHAYAIMVDEAHNLVDRAREMFSAELTREELLALEKLIAEDLPLCAKALRKLCTQLAALRNDEGWFPRDGAWVSKAAPEKLGTLLNTFVEQAELWLIQEVPAPFREELLNAYFQALAFQRVLDLYDDSYITIYDAAMGRLRLFCRDPARLLAEVLKRTGSTVYFSATLRPAPYFRQILGGEALDQILQLSSPFPRENFAVLVQDQIPTRLNARLTSCDAVASSIAAFVAARTGNYIVFFPSYAYMAEVLERFRALCPAMRTQAQTSQMTEEQREDFLKQFQSDRDQTFVAFAVLGGVFGEGIDLVGERLIGVAVVGVGLPQICLERELIKEQSGRDDFSGFDYAYTFPGLNRVLQAAGRVIRSETDRGIVLLIDERFRKQQYRNLFPEWWIVKPVRSSEEISATAKEFWAKFASTRVGSSG